MSNGHVPPRAVFDNNPGWYGSSLGTTGSGAALTRQFRHICLFTFVVLVWKVDHETRIFLLKNQPYVLICQATFQLECSCLM